MQSTEKEIVEQKISIPKSSKDLEHELIKSMAGNYTVTFKFAETFEQGAAKSDGCIVGSAYIKFLNENKIDDTHQFVNRLRKL